MGALIVFGYGPGIAHATAERFGREGYPWHWSAGTLRGL
jgi:hypothetical protein